MARSKKNEMAKRLREKQRRATRQQRPLVLRCARMNAAPNSMFPLTATPPPSVRAANKRTFTDESGPEKDGPGTSRGIKRVKREQSESPLQKEPTLETVQPSASSTSVVTTSTKGAVPKKKATDVHVKTERGDDDLEDSALAGTLSVRRSKRISRREDQL